MGETPGEARLRARPTLPHPLHIQYGYHMTGHRTITQSAEHSINLYHKNVAQSTWADPACIGHWQFASRPPSTTTGGPIPSEEAGNYLPAPHDCDAIDTTIIEFILSTVTDETEREDLEEECNGDARTLIMNIQAYRPPAEVGTWALAKRTRIVSTGIEVPTVKGFNAFRTSYNLHNEQCHVPDTHPQCQPWSLWMPCAIWANSFLVNWITSCSRAALALTQQKSDQGHQGGPDPVWRCVRDGHSPAGGPSS